MKKILLFLLPLFLLGCNKDDPQPEFDIPFRFQLRYDGTPLQMLQDYQYPDGKTIRFTRFSFYLSELVLEGEGQSEEVLEVAFVDLSPLHTSGSVNETPSFTTRTTISDITNVRFVLGLTEEMNQRVPADFESSHPLAAPGEYWLAWDSYIFVKVEGWVDFDDDGMAETPMAIHLGSNEVRRSLDFSLSENTNQITFDIDLRSFFMIDELYDIEANPQIHSLSQLPESVQLADNLTRAIHVN